MAIPLSLFLPMPLGGGGVSYTCSQIAQGIANDSLAVTIVTPRVNRRYVPSVEVVEVLPRLARYLPYRWLKSFANGKIEGVFLSQMARGRSQPSVAYIWPDATAETIRELKQDNVTIFREMVNCPRGTAKIILDRAYEQLGAPPRHQITTESVNEENEALEAVDYIFCPSPMVHSSLLQMGTPTSKLLHTSYGWDPARLSRSSKVFPRSSGLNAVFVGTISVRKGIHLLLNYWAQSGVKGRLTLAGPMEPTIKEKCADLLNREDVVVLDFVDDVGALYRSADVFLLPSLEEGSPLVTYEACGSGLSVVTSPMGAGGVIRDNCEGFVIDPYDGGAWIAAIQRLANDPELRSTMAKAAAKRAEYFIWSSVAARRRQQIVELVKKN
jgi:glycosyltransferase involved in cell wall biosynthesis